MVAQSNGVITPVVFDFNSLSIRAIADEFGNPWFVAKDVCAILGHSRPGIAVKDHCRQDGTTKRCIIDRLGREQETLLINEGNLYRPIIRSKKPEAERFEIKLMDEILPTLRKTGKYEINAHQQPIPDHSAQIAEIEKIFQQQYKKLKKHYNYPRKLLEQSGFVSADGKHPARLNLSMLANTKAFVSPLMHLLNELRTDGHDVSAPWDEAIAMRDAIIAANNTLEEIYMTAIEATVKPASTAGNK